MMKIGELHCILIRFIASDLAEDIQEAKTKYVEKRDHYIALSISFKDRVAQWKQMSGANVGNCI